MKKFSKLCFAIVFVASFSFLIGCTHTEYELELTPDGSQLERQLTFQHHGQPEVPENEKPILGEEDRRIANVYGAAPIIEGKRFRYSALFAERMPDDIGGYGSYRRWNSPFGSATVYMERVRGSDDLATLLDGRRVAVNDLTDFIVEWFDAELGGTQGYDNLHMFLETQFRNDLQNLSIYIWQLGQGAERNQFEFAFRIGQYLMERDYLTLEEFPELVRDFSTQEHDESEKLLTYFHRMVISKLDNNEIDTRNAIQFLTNSNRLESSLKKHALASKKYKQLLDGWIESNDQLSQIVDDPELNEPEASEVIGSLAFEAFFPYESLFGTELKAKINLPCKPTFTNGVWNPEDSSASWDRSIGDRDQMASPDFLFAFWCETNEEEQVRHFGKVALSEKQLGQYVIWYNGLQGHEKTNWEKFIASLNPNGRLRKQIKSFGKANESDTFLGKGVSLLLTGLEN